MMKDSRPHWLPAALCQADGHGIRCELPHARSQALSAVGRAKSSVHTVHAFRVGLARTAAGVARIPHVLESSQCFQGPEFRSSPTSGTAYPSSEGVFALSVYKA